MTSTRHDPDEIALLEKERDFLLRSLDDLERERTDGNIDPDDYRRLHDDYTAQAAAVLRSIRDGIDARPQAQPASTRRRILTIGAIVVFALVAAVILGGALGERLPGQTATGNQQLGGDPAPVDTPADDLDALQAAVDDDPDDVEARLAYADALLVEGRAAEALRQYDVAAELDPDNARSRASSSFVVFQAGLVEDALERLDAAEAADPTYPETYFLRGIVLFRGVGDTEAAEAAFAHYLEVAPEGPYAADVEVILEQIRQGQTADEDEGE